MYTYKVKLGTHRNSIFMYRNTLKNILLRKLKIYTYIVIQKNE